MWEKSLNFEERSLGTEDSKRNGFKTRYDLRKMDLKRDLGTEDSKKNGFKRRN